MKKTPKIFQKINTRIPLPSLPQSLFQLVRICSDPDCPTDKIVRTVTTDPALTLKLLQVAGQLQTQPLSHASIALAAETLGPRQLKNLASTRLIHVRSNPLLRESRLYFHALWLRSLCCAMLAGNLAAEIRPEFTKDAYLAGLLHDCGALLLWAVFGKKYASIRPAPSDDMDWMRQTEIDAVGTDRLTVGRYLLNQLNVHPFIAEAVFHQHRSHREMEHALPPAQAVHAAARIGRSGKYGDLTAGLPDADPPFDSWTLQQAAAKTDLQMERLLQEMQTSPRKLLEEGKSRKYFFLPNDIAENFYSSFSVHLALQAADSAPAEEIQKRLEQSLLLYFEMTPVRFFYYDPATETLVGRQQGKPLDIDGIRLDLKPRAGLLAQCLVQQKITDSFGYLAGESKSVFDREIVALLNTEGMLCIPLVHRQNKIGVICAGVNESQMPLMLTDLGPLEEFGRQASGILGPRLDEEAGRIHPAAAAADFYRAARRVVHEVNTPLSIIKNYLALLRTKITDHAEAREDIRLIGEEIDRIPGIIAQLYRTDPEKRKPDKEFDVNETIDDLIRLLEKSVFKDTKIRLQFRPDRGLPKFSGKKNHLLQVLTNLLKNSAEAMADGGIIVIQTQFRRPSGRKPGRIQITVKDDGPGIAAEIMESLFEPGTSSKGPDHFGLGLSICKDIVELYGGSIHCTSSPGRGAMFRIELPTFGPAAGQEIRNASTPM